MAGGARLTGTTGAGCEQGQRWVRATHARVADRRGPVVSGGEREGESKSEVVVGATPTCGPGPHSAGRRNSTRFESKRSSTGFKLILN
jgi:hypothetical protein